MRIIVLLAVIGVVLLQWTSSIPDSSVGGPMTVALAYFVAALAVGVHEAWTMKRGVIGWAVNILVAFVGAFLAAQLSGMLMVMLIHGVGHVQGSLAQMGGPLLTIALVGGMLGTILGSWAAIQLVNRWR